MAEQSGRRVSAEIPLFGFLMIALLLSSLSWTVATNDEAIWHYIGWSWANGHAPYTMAVENKGPGIFSLYALSSLIFGIDFGPVRFVGSLAVWGTAVALCVLVRRRTNARAALMTALIFGLVNCWTAVDAGFSDSTENFEVFFTTLAFVVANSRPPTLSRAVMAGVLAGLAISFKQSAIFTGAALLAALLLQAPSIMVFTSFVGGGLAGVVFFLVPALISGTRIGDYIQFSWLVLTYKGISGAPSTGIRIDSFLRTWSGPMRLFIPFAANFLLRRRSFLETGLWTPMVLWLGAGFVMVNSSGVTHPHQIKEILAPLSVVAALGVEQLIAVGGIRASAVVLVLVLAFFPDGALEGFRHVPDYLFRYQVNERVFADVGSRQVTKVAALKGRVFSEDEFDFQMHNALGHAYDAIAAASHRDARFFGPIYTYEDVAMRDLGEYLRSHTGPSERIFVFGRGPAALAMLYSNRQSSTRFFCNILLYGYNLKGNSKFLTLMLQELHATPPVLLAIPLDITAELPYTMPSWLQQLVSHGYSKVALRDGFAIYRRTVQ
ncbi:MAG TPA: glycosyltransferase family 39 protein [Rhizomicrobium sp.]|nr:glycosyltransferase family 39 protein [Rhizomicrobium sp.]